MGTPFLRVLELAPNEKKPSARHSQDLANQAPLSADRCELWSVAYSSDLSAMLPIGTMCQPPAAGHNCQGRSAMKGDTWNK